MQLPNPSTTQGKFFSRVLLVLNSVFLKLDLTLLVVAVEYTKFTPKQVSWV